MYIASFGRLDWTSAPCWYHRNSDPTAKLWRLCRRRHSRHYEALRTMSRTFDYGSVSWRKSSVGRDIVSPLLSTCAGEGVDHEVYRQRSGGSVTRAGGTSGALHCLVFEVGERQGYAPCSLRRRIRIAVGFSRWLAKKSVRLHSVSSRHFDQYLRYRARQQRICEGDAAALKQLLDFLRDGNLIPVEIRQLRPSPIEQHVRAYERYLREERALATATIVNYVRFIREFLKDCFGSAPVRLSQLCAGDVVRFVQRQTPRLHLKTAKLLTTALRSFLQYTRYRGFVRLDLAAAVPVVANWSMPSIPRAIAADQVRHVDANQSTYRDRTTRLCDFVAACTVGFACHRSGVSRTR